MARRMSAARKSALEWIRDNGVLSGSAGEPSDRMLRGLDKAGLAYISRDPQTRKFKWVLTEAGKALLSPVPAVRGAPRGNDAWAEDWKEQFVELTSEGASIRKVAKRPDMPSPQVIARELSDDDDFAGQYMRAREGYADDMFEEIKSIADGVGLTHEAIGKARLKIDSRKWMLSKLRPSKYGDRTVDDADANVVSDMPIKDQVAEAVDMIPILRPLLRRAGYDIFLIDDDIEDAEIVEGEVTPSS